MSDGTRIDGARSKGVIAATAAKAGKPCKGNPYSDARPAMKSAWEEGFASVMDSEPAPAKPESGFPGKLPKVKPSKAAKVKALAAQTPFTVDEIAAAAEGDDVLLGGD